ncbi:MAG: NADH-quinone oxidoreductase subunit A [Nitrospirae bacterium]|nr:NADH-quinone oxidoreductase subunit A [Nitrospirota bacterium]
MSPRLSFDLAVVFGFLLVSAALLWVLLAFGKLVRMRRPIGDKLTTYECGERPFGSAWFSFNNRFYVIALVFVAFDVQVALAVPAVVVFRRLLQGEGAGLVFGVLFVYLGLMMLALAYVWRHGDLGWVRELRNRGPAAADPREAATVPAPAVNEAPEQAGGNA